MANPYPTGTSTPQDMPSFARRDDETIQQAGFASIRPADINRELGCSIPDLVSCYRLPYPETEFFRYRCFYAEGVPYDKEKHRKYHQHKGSGNRVYIPHGVKSVLLDPLVELFITEGEKKALKGVQEGIHCVGLPGLWNWKNKDQDKLIADFDRINLEHRTVFIVPDSDWLNPNKHGERKNLKQAVRGLGERIRERGATVFIINLPDDAEGKTGLDDYLLRHTVDEFRALRTTEVFLLSERIEKATIDNYQDLLCEIAKVEPDSKKEGLVKALAQKTRSKPSTLMDEVKAFESGHDTDNPANIVLAHPAYHVDRDFVSLGFREVVIVDQKPVDRNFYLVAAGGAFGLHDKPLRQDGDKTIIFDERERFLIWAEDRWPKARIQAFIENPQTPAGLYVEIRDTIRQFIEFPKEPVYGLMAAWIIGTYFHRIFNAYPFVFFPGPKTSGKSRSLDVLERLCFSAMKIKGVSVAAMADSIDGTRGTFLNDQAELLATDKFQEILGILTDSYTVGGGKRRLVDISNHKRRVIEFETYGPKAFASTKDLDSDLKDRCIEIKMLRAAREYPDPDATLPAWQDLRDKLYRLFLTRWQDARRIYENSGQDMRHRVKELWRPIETILILESVPGEEQTAIRRFFLESMLSTQYELSESEMDLFETLLGILKGTSSAILTIDEIAKGITRKPREEMTARALQSWVGKAMHRFSLFTAHAGRKDKKRAYRFEYDHVQDVFKRYCSIESAGTSGHVVIDSENQQDTSDHIAKHKWSASGQPGNGEKGSGHVTTCEPHTKTNVVNGKSVKLGADDHMTTSKADSTTDKKSFVDLSLEDNEPEQAGLWK